MLYVHIIVCIIGSDHTSAPQVWPACTQRRPGWCRSYADRHGDGSAQSYVRLS